MNGNLKQRAQLQEPGNCEPPQLSQRSYQSGSSWSSQSAPLLAAAPTVKFHSGGDAKQNDAAALGRGSDIEFDCWPSVTYVTGSTFSIPFAEERQELEDMWRKTSVNKFYLPISKLPPLRGDPRPQFGKKAPACYREQSVPRAHRIMHRWQSMPTMPGQLKLEHLRTIEETERVSTSSSSGVNTGCVPGRGRRTSCILQESMAEKEKRDAEAQEPVACPHELKRKVEKEYPHIPCKCCEHPRPKPWLQKRNMHTAAASSVAPAVAP